MKDSIKLIATDLDGTLLVDGNFLNDVDINTIKKIQDIGYKVMAITGQPYYSAIQYCQKLDLDKNLDILVADNGAYISKVSKQEPILSIVLNFDVIKNVCEEVEKYDDVKVFCTSSQRRTLYVDKKIDVDQLLEHAWFENWDFDYISNLSAQDEIHQMTIIAHEAKDELIDNMLKKYSNLISWSWDYADEKAVFTLCDKKATKGEGLKFISEYLNIDLKNIMVFGDGTNDITMFKIAGFPVAMGNADPKVKEVSKYETDSVENNGVTKFIIENLLEGKK